MKAEREVIVAKNAAEPAKKLSMTEKFAARQKIRNCHGAGGSGQLSLPMRRH